LRIAIEQQELPGTGWIIALLVHTTLEVAGCLEEPLVMSQRIPTGNDLRDLSAIGWLGRNQASLARSTPQILVHLRRVYCVP